MCDVVVKGSRSLSHLLMSSCLNNTTHFHHLTSRSTPCCRTAEIILWPQLSVTSLHPVYSELMSAVLYCSSQVSWWHCWVCVCVYVCTEPSFVELSDEKRASLGDLADTSYVSVSGLSAVLYIHLATNTHTPWQYCWTLSALPHIVQLSLYKQLYYCSQSACAARSLYYR